MMLVFGIALIIFGAISAVYGNYLNNDLEKQLESIFNNGQSNPGDTALYAGIALIILGIVFVIIAICRYKLGSKERSNSNTQDPHYKWFRIVATNLEAAMIFAQDAEQSNYNQKSTPVPLVVLD